MLYCVVYYNALQVDNSAVQCGAKQCSTLKLSMWKQHSQALFYNTFIQFLERTLYWIQCLQILCGHFGDTSDTDQVTKEHSTISTESKHRFLNCTLIHSSPLYCFLLYHTARILFYYSAFTSFTLRWTIQHYTLTQCTWAAGAAVRTGCMAAGLWPNLGPKGKKSASIWV